MTRTRELYESYVSKMARIADVRYASALLQWDQETYLPPKGAPYRGQQLTTLSSISHELFCADDLGIILEELMGREDLNTQEKRNVALTLDDYRKNKKYPAAFVSALSSQVNKTFHAWIESRKANSFKLYEKELDALVKLKREETGILGFEGHPYNALLDEFEKGCTTTLLDKTFSDLLPKLRDILSRISKSPQVDDSFLRQLFPKQEQWNWGMELIRRLSFDFEAGRQDMSEHPFSTSLNARDVRITTRIDEQDFANMTWSCIHETGHALYEQGLPLEQYGLPLGEACSYSMHESQSRLWENNVGRGIDFWTHFYPLLQQHFPAQLGKTDLQAFFKGINKVEPSLVRTEADEITYHFHVYIRYELEKKLIEGSLSTSEIPGYWNNQYRELMGVTVPDDKRGCLQDVHWSHGSFGYFPTYSLGSFYAAQFYNKAQTDVITLKADLQAGKTEGLLGWLRKNIHQKGRFFTSEELCADVTGEGLNVFYFVNYLLEKYVSIYNL
jgi:carboxypeptidase Taq